MSISTNVRSMAPMLVVALLVLAFCASVPGGDDKATGTQDAPRVKVADLAWMQGRWVGESDGDRLEEVWSAPSGDCMMGMFRWIKGGKVWMYELLTIVEDADGITFRFKHFDRKLVGWEEKDESLTFRLVSRGDREAVFRFVGDKPWDYIYRSTNSDSLEVVFQQEKDGKKATETIRFKRAAAGGS